jgi:acetylornithine deacetylase
VSSPAEYLRELVAISSMSSESNRPVIEKLRKFFAALGWSERVLSYRDDQGVEKLNLIVSPMELHPGTIEAELAIVCHTDTVPHSWPEATELQERDGMLHGCGACDVKGFLACMMAAAADLDARALQHRLCMVFTSDEEIGCRGARFLVKENALRAKYAIVGEPTSLVPARAGKGYGLAEILVTGQSAHSAYPEKGRSAILVAGRLLGEIEAIAESLQSDRNEAFSPAWTTVNVGEIRGGTAKNVVPAECRFLVEWRPVAAQDPELVVRHLRALAEKYSVDGVTVDVLVTRMDGGFETPLESAVIDAVRRGREVAVTSVAFGTEAPWLARMGAEAVVLGPGSMLTAHSPRECVPREELDGCVRILRTSIELLCS